MASSVRAPRVRLSVPHHANSSGIHETPTPNRNRSSARAAIDATCFATRSGLRSGSFTTLVRNEIRSVTAAMAGTATNGSTNGVSGCHHRRPSALKG